MSDLGFNKIAFCVLGTGLALIGLNEASHAMFHTAHHEKPGYDVPVPETSNGGPVVVAGPVDYLTLLTAADVAKGKEQAAKCLQCHHFEQGAGSLQGPELFNVVGRDIASMPGFKYSSGKGSLSELEGVWNYEHLDRFIAGPKRVAPATAMNFAGISSKITGQTDRINLIAYLRTLAPAGQEYPLPDPLPAQPAAPADGAAPPPADGAAPAAVPGATPAAPGQTAPATTPPAAPGPAAPTTPPAPAPH
jgi:cytochrome c